MACFTVTVAEAVVVTAAAQIIAHREKKAISSPISAKNEAVIANEKNEKIRFSKKLMWLASLLWGGSFLLAFEHLWHGEIVPWAPFLTAAASPDSLTDMLHEMATVGVAMTLLVTAIWAGIVAVTSVIEKRNNAPAKEEVANI